MIIHVSPKLQPRGPNQFHDTRLQAWGPDGCRQMGIAAASAVPWQFFHSITDHFVTCSYFFTVTSRSSRSKAAYTVTLASCSLLPTPKLYLGRQVVAAFSL